MAGNGVSVDVPGGEACRLRLDEVRRVFSPSFCPADIADDSTLVAGVAGVFLCRFGLEVGGGGGAGAACGTAASAVLIFLLFRRLEVSAAGEISGLAAFLLRVVTVGLGGESCG